MKRILLYLVAVIGIGGCLTSKHSSRVSEVPVAMYDFQGEMLRLQPFIASQTKFTDENNQEIIKEHLDNLQKISARLDHGIRLDTVTFQVSARALQNHFSELNRAFDRGRKKYAWWMLNSTLDGCSSCHSQVPSQKAMWTFRENELQGSSLEKAEFLFTLRHYDEALKLYNTLIANPKISSEDKQNLDSALQRKLFILVRAKLDPARALKELRSDLLSLERQGIDKPEARKWLPELKRLSRTKLLKEASASELERLVLQNTDTEKNVPISFVDLLHMSGAIFNFINTHPKTALTPELLYGLGVSEHRLSQSFFFSLSDEYLKECISRFPKSDTAKKCFSELESNLVNGFTGSGGTYIPDDVKLELEKYRKMLL